MLENTRVSGSTEAAIGTASWHEYLVLEDFRTSLFSYWFWGIANLAP